MADSARMRRGEPVSAAELAPVEGSSDLVPQEHMSQAQLMQLQAMDELEQQADEFWNVTSDYPLPAKNLYLVRVLLLVVPSLITVYYFIRVTLFPIGAVPLVYLVMHMWVAMIYRANRSVKVAAAIMTAFFAYALVTVQGPQTLLDRVGVFYTVSLLTVMASFALEVLFSLFYSLAVRRSLRLTRQKQQSEQQGAEEQKAGEQKAEEPNPAEPNTEAPAEAPNTEAPNAEELNTEASRVAEQS